jgi:tetratricopeptide (TPR) repeat protein
MVAGVLAVASAVGAQAPTDPAAALERLSAAAETSLRQGELQIADSTYRSALMAGWMVIGTLRTDERRLADARDAFQHASTSAVDARAALQALALVHLEMGEAPRAVTILTRLASSNGKNAQAHRLLAQALVANGQGDEAVQEMEEARGAAPDDPELAFMLASGYLRVKKLDAAEHLFAEVVKARPGAETYVLIGRTYRDAGQYDRARTALETALKMNPRVRRAHYYLGTVAVLAKGITRVDEAIAEFQQELRVAPTDVATNLRLGMALVEARRYNEALAPLELSVHAADAPADAFYYLGRCELHLERANDAVAAFRRALELSGNGPGEEARLRSVHYQLALALRETGATDEAEAHFAQAQESSANAVAGERDRLDRYLADAPDPSDVMSATPILDRSPLAALPEARRADLERRTRTMLARAYLNLGIMQTQQQRFARAAEFFEQAVTADADFPQAQYALAVAYFNEQQYEKAAAPLERLVAAGSGESDVRRMLALSYLNNDAYDKAAALLQNDPQTATDPALQYAYGLALVRSGRFADAEGVFARLLAAHGDTAELTVLVGQAHAQQGDFDAAIESLRKALRLDPRVADANATLGFIYFKQGRLQEAEQALRAELAAHADNVRARHTLAAVLELENQPDEAIRLLRAVLKTRPGFADARYLLGKILLAQGSLSEAVDHLEGAARLAPGDANIHYQLGQAYQKLERSEDAQKEFEAFQQLKDKRRGSGQ